MKSENSFRGPCVDVRVVFVSGVVVMVPMLTSATLGRHNWEDAFDGVDSDGHAVKPVFDPETMSDRTTAGFVISRQRLLPPRYNAPAAAPRLLAERLRCGAHRVPVRNRPRSSTRYFPHPVGFAHTSNSE
jgi:hypothetical protein